MTCEVWGMIKRQTFFDFLKKIPNFAGRKKGTHAINIILNHHFDGIQITKLKTDLVR